MKDEHGEQAILPPVVKPFLVSITTCTNLFVLPPSFHGQ